MMNRLPSAVAGIVLASLAVGDANAGGAKNVISGRAQAISGEMMMVGTRKVRIWGIEAADIDQPCTPKKTLTCGEYARIALQQLATGRKVRCRIKKRPSRAAYVVARCTLKGHGRIIDIGQELVQLGYAYAAVDIKAYQSHQLRIVPFRRPSEWRALMANRETDPIKNDRH